ncbi:hypothetical protein G7054_g3017 [Neopestalotiopsis clavispora]|nr:hypothetical protein G7054_g3017 [Neopestalotiopsis clavispora]
MHNSSIAELTWLFAKAYESKSAEAVIAATTTVLHTISTLPPNDEEKSDLFFYTGQFRFEHAKVSGDTQEAVSAMLMAAMGIENEEHLCPGSEKHFHMLWIMAENSIILYNLTGELHHLEAGIEHEVRADTIRPTHGILGVLDPWKRFASSVEDLWIGPMIQYQATGCLEFIDRAIAAAQEVIATIPIGYPDEPQWQAELTAMLTERFGIQGQPQDLEDAISAARSAAAALDDSSSCHSLVWMNLAASLCAYFETQRNLEDVREDILEEALRCSQKSLAANDSGCEVQANAFKIQASCYSICYTQFGKVEDLNEARRSSEAAIKAVDSTSRLYLEAHYNLATIMLEQFLTSGEESQLIEAITLLQKSISTAPLNRRYQITAQMNLATMLGYRFQQTGDSRDIEEAIAATENAIKQVPPNHYDKPVLISNLANFLMKRFSARVGEDTHDVKRAIELHQEAVSITPDNHSDYPSRCSDLANAFYLLYKTTRQPEHRLRAIKEIEMAIDLMPKSIKKAHYMMERVDMLLAMPIEMALNNMAAVEKALSSFKQITDCLHDDHPLLSLLFCQWGIALEIVYEKGAKDQKPDPTLLTHALEHFIKGGNSPSGNPVHRVLCFRYALYLLRGKQDWDRASQVADDAIKLLPQICRRSISQDDQQKRLSGIAGLASLACSISLKAGKVSQALRQLEFGRGFILGYLIDGQTELQELRLENSALAESFVTLRKKSSSSIPENVSVAVRTRMLAERETASKQLAECEDSIRKIPGYESFLCLPSQKELQEQSEQGPIVFVNITTISSDAIIVTLDELIHLELPGMAVEQRTVDSTVLDLDSMRGIGSERVAHKFNSVWHIDSLTSLWNECVRPVLERLQTNAVSSDHLRRIWWIGSGKGGSGLPFHAASAKGSTESESSLDRIISSYTPTIRALRHSRNRAPKEPLFGKSPARVSVVTMPTTPEGQGPLCAVPREEELIREALGDSAIVTTMQNPSAKLVLDRFKYSNVMHFACHGESDPTDPSKSHLLLQRDPQSIDRLTAGSIMNAVTHSRACIAYLSACSTSHVKAYEYKDENLHLVSAFQAAGFAHVIGSLQPIDDYASADMAMLFYKYLRDWQGEDGDQDRAIADALRRATCEMRRRHPLETEKWAFKMSSTNIVLSFLLPVTAVKLGWLVLSVQDPCQDYLQPEDSILNAADIMTQQLHDFQQTLERSKDTNFVSYLSTLLSGGRGKQDTTKSSITSTLCTTHQLLNSSAFLEKLCTSQSSRAFIERAIRRSDDVFLITGMKTAIDSTVQSEVSSGANAQGALKMPFTMAATGAGVPIPVEGMLDVGIEANRERSQKNNATYTAPGEQIFAVQYRQLRFARFSREKMADIQLEKGNRWNIFLGSRGEDEEDEQTVEVEIGGDLENVTIDDPAYEGAHLYDETFLYCAS